METIKIAFFDFDGCLGATPGPETGKQTWAEHHQKPWLWQGWWGRVESMCLDAFSIKTHPEQHNSWKELYDQGYKTFVLTSRLPKFRPMIQSILIDNGVDMEGILTKTERTKGERIVEEVKAWNAKGFHVEHVQFFDDRMKEIVTVEAVRDELLALGTTIDIHKIQSDAQD